MEELTRWRKIIRDLLQHYASFKPAHGDVKIEVIADEALDHYELMYAGWHNDYRIHGPVIHIDIQDGKVWIQRDGTEDGVADQLVAAGIPKDKIVLAFKSPEMRQYTGFAVA
jgi:hypothetical protein